MSLGNSEAIFRNMVAKYELQPPEGGWGYVVTVGVSLMFVSSPPRDFFYLFFQNPRDFFLFVKTHVNLQIVTVVPLCSFGMVFGGFLANLGDEATGTALANGIFNTVLSFTGLAANQLLQKYSCRTVAFLGAFVFFLGAFSTIFVTNLVQLVVSLGILQGWNFLLEIYSRNFGL